MFQNGHYVKEKEYEGVGIVPYDPYHNSSFVVAGNAPIITLTRICIVCFAKTIQYREVANIALTWSRRKFPEA